MDSTTPTLIGLAPLISIEELSEYLNVPTRTLHDWSLAGRGPRAVHDGRQRVAPRAARGLTGRAPEGP